jgi:hypothetical protein
MKRICEEFSGEQGKAARVRTIRREIYAEKCAKKTAIQARAFRPSCHKIPVPRDSNKADGENIAFFVGDMPLHGVPAPPPSAGFGFAITNMGNPDAILALGA